MAQESFYRVEYSRSGNGQWHLELWTTDKKEATERYNKGVEEFSKFVWRISLVKEIKRSR